MEQLNSGPFSLRSNFRSVHNSKKVIGETCNPSLNLSESKREYKVTMELPGVNEDDLDVVISSDFLCVSGRKSKAHDADDVVYHEMERECGYFYRTVPFPTSVHPERAYGELEKGLLTIRVLKTECLDLC